MKRRSRGFRRSTRSVCQASGSVGCPWEALEALEPRRLLSTFTVLNTLNSGYGSLRQAVLNANAAPGSDVIRFASGVGGEIGLTSGELLLTDDVSIRGPGAARLSVSGRNLSRVFNVAPSVTASISSLTITRGNGGGGALYGHGGGIYNGGTLTLTDSTVSGNATQFAGGIYNTGTLTLNRSTVSGNTAVGTPSGAYAHGGGIINSSGATLNLANATVSGNTASLGGGIYTAGALSLANSTVTDNTATNAAGVYVVGAGTLRLRSTIVAGNTGPDLIGTLSPDSRNNLIGGEPMLGPLANNGGPTQTHALLEGSPAIGGGINPLNLTTDQRGGLFSRGTAVDIGAYQRQTLNLVVDTLTDEDDGDYGTGDLSLREAIGAAGPNPGNDTITFADSLRGGTITLGGSHLSIAGDVAINGPGAELLTINANNASGVFAVESSVTASISGVTVTGGNAFGGGIFNQGTLSLAGAAVSGNTGYYGGGIFNPGTLSVTDSIVSGNTSISSFRDGGGIFNRGVAVVDRTTISGNSGSWAGGLLNQSRLTVTNSTISSNFGQACIYNEESDLTIINSTISDNTSDGIENSYGQLSVSNSTITRNGVGIRTDSRLPTLRSTILAGNIGADLVGAISAESIHNLVGGDPRLGPLAHNGGPTRTHEPLADSPAIGAGRNPLGLATDQRGGLFARGIAVDIGAYQRQSFALVVDTLADNDDGNYGAGNLSLREAIGAAGPNPGNDTIFFDPSLAGGTITLGGTEIRIEGRLTIIGLGANLLSVSGGGASRVLSIEPDANATLSGLTITGGNGLGAANPGNGGGILNRGTLTLTASTISGNTGTQIGSPPTAYGWGGGIYNQGDLTLLGSTVSGNTSPDDGGGVFSRGGSLTITNSTVSGNQAALSGGGVWTDGSVSIANSTITANAAFRAGGVRAEAATVRSTIIAGNTGGDLDADLAPSSASNLIGGDPLLGPLGDNGGPTRTHAVLEESPAKGNGANPLNLATDQRGLSRAAAGLVDIGSFQTQEVLPSEIGVLGGGQLVSPITHETKARRADGTGFGPVQLNGETKSITYRIVNNGTGPLIISAIEPRGQRPGDYQVVVLPDFTIAPGGSTTFIVSFDPTDYGTRRANIAIFTNDPDRARFTMRIAGRGVPDPVLQDIDVTGGTRSISDNDRKARSGTGQRFGSVDVGQSVVVLYTITNTGQTTLSFGAPIVRVTGASAGDFSVLALPASSVLAPGASTSFSVLFSPTTIGARKATIEVLSDDPDEGVFNFRVKGAGL